MNEVFSLFGSFPFEHLSYFSFLQVFSRGAFVQPLDLNLHNAEKSSTNALFGAILHSGWLPWVFVVPTFLPLLPHSTLRLLLLLGWMISVSVGIFWPSLCVQVLFLSSFLLFPLFPCSLFIFFFSCFLPTFLFSFISLLLFSSDLLVLSCTSYMWCSFLVAASVSLTILTLFVWLPCYTCIPLVHISCSVSSAPKLYIHSSPPALFSSLGSLVTSVLASTHAWSQPSHLCPFCRMPFWPWSCWLKENGL